MGRLAVVVRDELDSVFKGPKLRIGGMLKDVELLRPVVYASEAFAG